MGLPYAYCIQSSRVVDISEARDLYFSQAPPRKDLKFLCPDDLCRAEFSPAITGVNYKKILGQDNFILKPHFRMDSRPAHHPDCPWFEIVEVMDLVDAQSSGQSELVQVFLPTGENGKPQDRHIPVEVISKIKKLPAKSDRINAYKKHLGQKQRTTSRLHEAVRCYKGMSIDDLKTTPFRIGDLPVKTFAKYFAHVRYCSPDSYYPRIYYGEGNVRRWKTGYSIRFAQKARQRDGADCTVTIFVANTLLEAFSGRDFLLATLEAAIDIGGNAAECFVFGYVTRNAEREHCVDISLDSLHSMVLILSDHGDTAETR